MLWSAVGMRHVLLSHSLRHASWADYLRSLPSASSTPASARSLVKLMPDPMATPVAFLSAGKVGHHPAS